MIIEANEELSLIPVYAESKVWEQSTDHAWKADLDEDIKRDIQREDAANGVKSTAS